MPWGNGLMTHDEVMQWMGVIEFACLVIASVGWAVTGYFQMKENDALRERLDSLLKLRDRPDAS